MQCISGKIWSTRFEQNGIHLRFSCGIVTRMVAYCVVMVTSCWRVRGRCQRGPVAGHAWTPRACLCLLGLGRPSVADQSPGAVRRRARESDRRRLCQPSIGLASLPPVLYTSGLATDAYVRTYVHASPFAAVRRMNPHKMLCRGTAQDRPSISSSLSSRSSSFSNLIRVWLGRYACTGSITASSKVAVEALVK